MTEEYRLKELERRLNNLEDKGLQGQLDLLKNMLTNLDKDVKEAREEIKGLKRALIGAIGTLLVGMLLFLFTFTATGLLK